MRILIGLHDVVLGGDTINALELACRLRERGHDATLFAIVPADLPAAEAPLLTMAEQRAMPVHRLERPYGFRGRMRLVTEMAQFVRDERVDVVHAFGHQDTYFTFCGTHGLGGAALVVNDYAMTLTPGLPRHVPLVVGTEEVREQARRVRRGPTFLVEPPVDADSNRPGVVDPQPFRRSLGIGHDDVLLVMVSRLVRKLKSEGLHAAIGAVRILEDPAIRLVLVGGGEAAEELAKHAAQANAQLGREAVLLPGPMDDPRTAYAAADIVLGMGHSGLRGMAFGKPVVVVGEQGFSLPMTPESFAHFAYHGIYGLGDGRDGAPRLAEQLRPLLRDSEKHISLGRMGRRLVEERYSLDAAAKATEEIYRKALGARSWISWCRDAGYVAWSYAPAKLRRLRRVVASA